MSSLTAMTDVDGTHEAFPIAGTLSSSDNATVSSPPSSPLQSRRRMRTREISSLASPSRPSEDLGQQQEGSSKQGAAGVISGGTSEQPEEPSTRSLPPGAMTGGHRRVASGSLSSAADFDHLERVGSSSSLAVGSQTLGRRSMAPTSPPNAWLKRGSSKASLNSSSRYRGRSGSVGSFSGPDQSSTWQEDVPLASGSPRSRSGFNRTLSWKSVQDSVHNDGGETGGNRQHRSATDAQLAANGASHEVPSTGREKRRLFGRSSDRPSTSGGKGIIRRVSSRSFFGAIKDKDQDANASTDTLSSTATSSTTRMELARKAGEALSRTTALPHWSRRARKGIGKRESSTPATVENETESKATSTWSTDRPLSAAAGEEYTDVTPRGEKNVDGEAANLGASSENLGSAVNGLEQQDRGDGIPKRLSGWLSNMLGSNGSISSSQLEQEGGLSSSESTTTVRRRTSAISLSRQEGDAGAVLTVPPSLAGPGSSTAQTPASKTRSIGLLSSLSASGRSRTETSGAGSSGGVARSGLDRALRYFLDGGEQNHGQEEGVWLLGVWHGPKQMEEESSTPSHETHNAQSPTIEIINPSPNVRASKASTTEGNASSSSRRESDWDRDDTSTEDSSRRTRETSPSIASASTGGSAGRSGKMQAVANERCTTPDEGPILARNPPTPHASPSIQARTATAAIVTTPQEPTSTPLLQSREHSSSLGAAPSHMASFQVDFSSRVWCTYRSHFVPINRDGTISSQAERAAAASAAAQASLPISAELGDDAAVSVVKPKTQRSLDGNASSDMLQASTSPVSAHSMSTSSSSQGGLGSSMGIQFHNPPSSGLGDKMGLPNLWSRATAAAQAYGLSGRAGLTTDAGWGCMLRTGQSVLANALLNVHMGREWRRGIKPTSSAMTETPVEEYEMRQQEYAKYVQLLSWFMDEPSLACPFGVHRMAREGKRLGKEVGEWFGPSTAAGAIKKLVDDYPEAGLGVTMASDGVVYLNQVKTQAQTNSSGTHQRVGHWDRPVLILIGVRLGLEGVHPMYHDSIKATFSFPQSVGIAGGRPSSSYYFVGYQGNSLFYLDPHHVRSSIPFRHPPPDLQDETSWWVQAYSEAELSTYHNDRPRRMPMKSLDPSMLLGFLISDEDSLSDFVNRVKVLPRPIFSVLESMPKWMMEDEEGTLHEDEKALESFSESSLDDAGGEVEETLEQEECESGPRPGEGRKTDQNGPLHHSVMSNQTATPRSDSTFEFIESQPMLLQTTPVEMRNHHVFLNNSKDAPITAAAKERVPSISRSVTDSDDVGSAWEEVGSDNGQQREPTSSPVEARE